MSLKGFHIFFIAVSTLTAFGFGVWGVYQFLTAGQGGYLALGLASAVIGVVLVIYGINFLHKFKHLRNL